MSASDPYCELCDLPTSQCVHGLPAEVVQPSRTATKAAAPRARKPVARSRSSAVSTTASAAAVTRRPARRWTPPEVFAPVIVAVLEEAGGELEADEAFAALEARVGDGLLAGDRETTPEGELRWRYAARRARVALLAEGRMEKTTPGVWKLATPR